jgi:hypothetical protein
MNWRFQMQGGKKLDFAETDQCKPVLLGLSFAGDLVKLLMSLYETEWRESGYGLRATISIALILLVSMVCTTGERAPEVRT